MARFKQSTRARTLGVGLLVASFLVTAYIAFAASAKEPPSLLTNAVLAIFSAGLQIAAGISFTSVGKANPDHARSSVRHLVKVGLQAREARLLAERAFDGGTASERHEAIGRLSVYLSIIEQDAQLAVEDWKDFHADAIADLAGIKKPEVRS